MDADNLSWWSKVQAFAAQLWDKESGLLSLPLQHLCCCAFISIWFKPTSLSKPLRTYWWWKKWKSLIFLLKYPYQIRTSFTNLKKSCLERWKLLPTVFPSKYALWSSCRANLSALFLHKILQSYKKLQSNFKKYFYTFQYEDVQTLSVILCSDHGSTYISLHGHIKKVEYVLHVTIAVL